MSPDELAVELAGRFREAHRRVARLDVPDDQKARVARRLVALTDASKVDLERASTRLDRLLADLDAGRLPAPEGDDSGA